MHPCQCICCIMVPKHNRCPTAAVQMYLLQYPLRAGDRSYDEHGAVQHVRAALSPSRIVGSAQLIWPVMLPDAAVLSLLQLACAGPPKTPGH